MARFTYAAYEYPETSYIVATPQATLLKGMYISPDSNHYSLLPVHHNGINYLLAGGESHIPGVGSAKKRQRQLIAYTNRWFTPVDKTVQSWGAMDYMAYDGLALIGKLYPRSERLFTISGLKKWGLAGSMVGAKGITSLLNNELSDVTRLFNPHRKSAPMAIPGAAIEYLKK